MSAKTDKFKLEFTKLTEVEKVELIKFINDYQSSNTVQKSYVTESLKRSLGPTDSAQCGCCGR
jgi:hypothetical protein